MVLSFVAVNGRNDRVGRQFRAERNVSQENIFIQEAVPQSTRYKTKWAVGIFKEWQSARRIKRSAKFDGQKIQHLTTQFEAFNGESLAVWLGKFVQEVTNQMVETIQQERCIG